MQVGWMPSLSTYVPAAREALPWEPAPLTVPSDSVALQPVAIEEPRPRKDPAQALITGAFVSLAVATSFVPTPALSAAPPEASVAWIREKREDEAQGAEIAAKPDPRGVSVEQPAEVRAPIALTMEASAPAEQPAAGPSLAKPAPAKPQAALEKAGTVLDDNLSWNTSHPVPWRTFGHRAVGGAWFDPSGRWADSQTAVTADQVAAMSPPQRQALARQAGVRVEDLRVGDASRVLLDAAVGTLEPGDVLDTGLALKSQANERILNFGHEPVDDRLFSGRKWADTGTVVSADQAAAMSRPQRNSLALAAGVPFGDLRLGEADRVLREADAPSRATSFDAMPPDRIVTTHGFRMTAKAAAHYERLLGLVGETFPGRGVRITSTMGGRHSDPRHRQGRAIDFVVEPLTIQESKTLEKLAWRAGFHPYNEYVHDSKYKTGPHMHVSLD